MQKPGDSHPTLGVQASETRSNKAIIFVDGSASYKNVRSEARELAVLAVSNPKRTIVVYNSDEIMVQNGARSELRELLGSFNHLPNIKFVRESFPQAIKPYEARPNLDLVQYSMDEGQAIRVEKELGPEADRVILFVGPLGGALSYGLEPEHLEAVKLNKPVEDIQSKNGYRLVLTRASESMRLLQKDRFVTVFAHAA